MKITLLLPFSIDQNHHDLLRHYIPDEDVEIISLKNGRVAEVEEDNAWILPEELETIYEAERNGSDAIVVACCSDPGVIHARERCKIPVIGAFQTGLRLAAMLGDQIGIISPSKYVSTLRRRQIRGLGLENRVSYRAPKTLVAIDIVQQGHDYLTKGKVSDVVHTIADEGVKAVVEDDCDILMIGCNALMWVAKPAEDEIRKRGYNISLVVPMTAALGVARVMVKEKLAHSNLFYPKL